MNKRRILLGAMLLALWVAFAGAPRAFAQDPSRISELKISVWPEYDTPSVLVILDGTLADAANLPREISILIPPNASLLAATWRNAAGTPAPEEPTKQTKLENGYTRVTYTVRTAQIYLEYYDDLLRGSPDKSMDFSFQAPAPIDQATLEVQQPLKATNFSIDPPAKTTRDGTDGFKYYTLQFSSLSAGQIISAQVKYTKADPNPSVLPPLPSITPIPAPAADASPSLWNNIFILVALVLLGLVAVLGFFLIQQRSREPASTRTAERGRSRRGGERVRAASQVAAYCTQCGHGLGPEDLFCPRCGTKRRVV